MRERKAKRELEWEKLDNTANLFPVIASESMSNVYRLSVVLTEEVIPEKLEKALQHILPWFDYMNVRMRTGVFWYYFETNENGAPVVCEEDDFPCRYIAPRKNNNFLFRVTYYKCRINLEIFHVLADGMGGINFLRELTYEYLRLVVPALQEKKDEFLSEDTSLNQEDAYLKYYRKKEKKGYRSVKAVHMTGEKFLYRGLGVMHGYLSVSQLKEKCRELHVSINDYLTAVFAYSIYQVTLHGMKSKEPVVVCVPVNLRSYFPSMTARNFFVMISAAYLPKEDNEPFEETLKQVTDSLKKQKDKDSLEKLFAYNVSNQKNYILRAVPLFLKRFAMRYVYQNSAKATTTTLTNISRVEVKDEYRPYIKRFQAMLSVSAGQNLKAAICSYGDELTITFTSVLKNPSVQQAFFKKLSEDGIPVKIETNGLWGE